MIDEDFVFESFDSAIEYAEDEGFLEVLSEIINQIFNQVEKMNLINEGFGAEISRKDSFFIKFDDEEDEASQEAHNEKVRQAFEFMTKAYYAHENGELQKFCRFISEESEMKKVT